MSSCSLLGKKKEEKLKGDKLRDLILIVYLNNKYDKDKNRIPWLREKLGYSTGRIYNALNDSGYLERTGDEISLTKKGTVYLNRQILPHYTAFNPLGNFLIALGFIFLLQWYSWTYSHVAAVLPWYSAIMIIVGGILVRFLFLRIVHWMMKTSKAESW
jgi:hypothetical protein